MKNKLIYGFGLLLMGFLNASWCISADNGGAKRFFYGAEISAPVKWADNSTIIKGDAYAGDFFFRTDAVHPFGVVFSDSVYNFIHLNEITAAKNDFQFKFSAQVRKFKSDGNGIIVTSIKLGDSTLYWDSYPLKAGEDETGKWKRIEFTKNFPLNFPAGAKISVYLWNQEGKSIVDMDDIEIVCKQLNIPTYLPLSTPNVIIDSTYNVLYKNDYYEIHYAPKTQSIQILNGKGEAIINGISYFFTGIENGHDTSLLMSRFKLAAVSKNILSFGTETSWSILSLMINVNDTNQVVDFKIIEKYKSKVEIEREALLFKMRDAVSEVYRKNTGMDTTDFQEEYWLDKEGIKAGKKDRAVYFYHNANISSCQLNNVANELVVNLDYALDHPLLHMPLLKDTTNVKTDHSKNHYFSGEVASFHFNLTIGIDNNCFPRFMKMPYGYEAALLLTEHADFTDIRTHRAVYFGDEGITTAGKATGGFIKWGIPVTKSVFYCNPDTFKNRGLYLKEPVAAIKEMPDLKTFLDELKLSGNEICLHTPEQFTTTMPMLKEALEFMGKEYGSHTWIDHGYDNPLKSNRENFVCDGLIKTSPYYAKRLWDKNGIKYFWNCFYEDIPLMREYKFDCSLTDPYIGFGDLFPSPYYWRNTTYAGSLISWPTRAILSPQNKYDYYFSPQRLNDFIQNRSIQFIHFYPASTGDSTSGYWVYNKGRITVGPDFDRCLQRFAAYKQAGKIYFATVGELLGYAELVENVDLAVLTGDTYRVTNKNNKSIEGLSLVVNAKGVKVNDKKPAQKIVNGEIIFWFDLAGKETATITCEK